MKFSGAMALLVCSTTALAGSAGVGTLHTVHVFSNGTVLVYTSGSRDGVPACTASQSARFALNGSTAGGKTLAAGIHCLFAGKTGDDSWEWEL